MKHLIPSILFLTPSLHAAELREGATTGTTSVTIDATDRGYYSATGNHDPANDNYYAGYNGSQFGNTFRNFFVFDLPGATVLSATLYLWNPSNGHYSLDPSETYSLFDVSTSIAALRAGGSGLSGIYNDLGSGTSYGSVTVTSASNGTYISIPLNSSFPNAANGGSIALGGAITTLSGSSDQDAFFGTGGGYTFDTQLSVTRDTGSQAQAGDYFGASVSLSGSIGLVGAFNDNTGGASSQGGAYLFRNLSTTTGSVTQNAKLIASDGGTGDTFGYSVSQSGTFGLVGSHGAKNNGSVTGSVYLFRNFSSATGTITQSAKLTASDGANFDFFGRAVSLSGNSAIVGAEWDDDKGIDSGSAYVFRSLNSATGNVTQNAKLFASDGAANDYFGHSLSLSGNNAIVGASGDDSARGSAYLFRNLDTATGTITQNAKLAASDGAADDLFGISASLFGNNVVVGAYWDDSQKGSAYLFRNLDTATGTVTENAKLAATDGMASDWFGWSVSYSGNNAIVGAYGDDDKGTNSGSAYLFRNLATTSSIVPEAIKLMASDGGAGDAFGFSVSIDGDNFMIGASNGDGTVANTGKAYTGSVFSITTLDAGFSNRVIDGISFVSRVDWITGEITDYNTVTLTAGDAATVALGAMYIGKNAGSDGNTLDIAGTLHANTVYIGAPAANSGNTLRLRATATLDIDSIYLTPGNSLVIEGDHTTDLFDWFGGTQLRAWVDGTWQPVNLANQSDYLRATHASGFTTVVLRSPEIALEHPVGVNLPHGGSLAFGGTTTGGSTAGKTVTVMNVGDRPLLISSIQITGANSGDFPAILPAVPLAIPPGGQESVVIAFSPGGMASGTRSATLEISSEDADESLFILSLGGLALSPTDDADGDGMNDWAEYQFVPLGFNWQNPQPGMVNTIFSGANAAGLYTSGQIQTLHSGVPLISRNPSTGKFKLTMDWKKSTNLADFFDFPAPASSVSVNPQGDIELEFTSPDNAAFFRLEVE